MKYISICSGIEAASTAWHGLGWTPLAFSEIEPFPSAVLAERHPSVPNLGDMSKYREWPEELLAECDLLVGGTPCQAFSVAGLRKSLDDERGNLSLIYVHLFHHINEVRKRHGRPPAIALWENVPGVLSTKDNAFGCFISGLLGVDDTIETQDGKWPKAGFLGSETVRVGYRVLDAQYFAVAQRRRRVFLVAVPCELIASVGERACPSEILSLRESVLGNPPTRGEAWEGFAGGVAERAASGGEPYHLDRAMFNQGVNAQYEPQITDDGVTASMVARGPAAVAFGGNRTSGPLDVATSCLANGSPHGRMDFASETFVVNGHPDPAYAISAGKQGEGGVFGSGRDSQDTFAVVAVRTAQTSANGHGVAEEVAHTLDQVQGQAVAFKPGQSEAAGGTFVTEEFAPTIQSQNNGSTAVPAVAYQQPKSIGFNWQNGGGYGNANDGLGITEEGTGPLSRSQVPACVTGPRTHALTTRAAAVEEDGTGRGTPIVPVEMVPFTKSKRAQSVNDDESWVAGEVAPTQNQFDVGDTRATTVVAFSPLQGGRSMPVTPESLTLEAGTGNKAPAVLAFANRTRDGVKLPEIMKDGVVPALTNPGQGGRSDAVNVLADAPVQVQWASGGGKVENPTMQALRTSAEHSYQFVRQAMQVRRLTPTECCRLQGFPDDHCDIVYRKKPAADGPKYRALGNSMAVPCMAWLGYRIQKATQAE
jgi:site-specific DNA-cytosine methylase